MTTHVNWQVIHLLCKKQKQRYGNTQQTADTIKSNIEHTMSNVNANITVLPDSKIRFLYMSGPIYK